MSKNIQTAILILQVAAVDVEAKIERIGEEGFEGCSNCGMLTQSDIDNDQEMRIYIQELQDISQSLDYLESLI
jgi:hypothetical protein